MYVSNASDISLLEKKIKYNFKDRKIIETALTHSSYTNEMKSRGKISPCNERLEFLGDSVLQIISSEMLFKKFPNMTEGDLSRIRSQIVCEKALGDYSNMISLGKYLLLGKGEEQNRGRYRTSILADAFEALIAAIYLDSDILTVKNFLLPFLEKETDSLELSKMGEDDKSRLQEIIQQEKNEKFEYILVEENGPAHAKEFVVEARLNSNVIGRGKGSTKRQAEQNAAAEALKLFGEGK